MIKKCVKVVPEKTTDMSYKNYEPAKRDRVKLLIFIAGYVLVMGVMLIFSGCERRELYVYGEDYRSAELNVDWRDYSASDPGGMTVWFYPAATAERTRPYRFTTASVRRYEFFVPRGTYQGVVVDYSPEEYSNQTFEDLDEAATASVRQRPAAYQPSQYPSLYGAPAWHKPLDKVEESGLYTVSDSPEEMALSTLEDAYVSAGAYGDYIPYKERDSYQQTITITKFDMAPRSIVGDFTIRIHIKGINNLYSTEATIAGLADGHYLVSDKNTDDPCLLRIDNWEVRRTGENEGYILAHLPTFGLRPASLKHSIPGETRAETWADGTWESVTDVCNPEELRLNLRFMLRDEATVVVRHFDVGRYVEVFEREEYLRLELDEERQNDCVVRPDGDEPGTVPGGDGGGIDLPYVEPKNGTGFSADVVPWQDTDPVDVDM